MLARWTLHGSVLAHARYIQVLTFADRIHLLACDVVETPIRLVNGYPKWSSMAFEVLFGELCNRYALLVITDCFPEPSRH